MLSSSSFFHFKTASRLKIGTRAHTPSSPPPLRGRKKGGKGELARGPDKSGLHFVHNDNIPLVGTDSICANLF